MTEPTGEPLLDRLDALSKSAGWEWRKWAGVVLTQEQAFELASAYPDLHALVLQYREERDRAIEERDDAREARDQFHSSGLVKMQHELQVRRERDALVEPLKGLLDAIDAEEAHMSLNVLEQAKKARAALPGEGSRDD